MRALQTLVLSVSIVLNPYSARAGSENVERNGTTYFTYLASPNEIDIFWLNAEGKPYRQFSVLQKALAADSRKIEFLMNGGIFEDLGVPSGLLIINGKILRPLNQNDGKGNFYLKPNGVFYIDATGAHILPTDDYALKDRAPRVAVQSGPLLLHAGKTHPAFQASSTNYLHRNGVGIRADGKVIFAITEFGQKRYPNLFEFADLFRSLGCDSALFLDGDLSQMVVDAPGPIEPGNHFGTIIGVAPKWKMRPCVDHDA